MRAGLPAAAAGLALAVAACGSSHPAVPSPSRSTVFTTVAPSTTAPYVPPSLAAPSSTGTLRATSVGTVPDALPADGDGESAVDAEAPDGTLFVAVGGSTAYVVDGLAKPVVAEHADAEITGLAADATSLYVVTSKDLTRYDRTSGRAVRTWALQLAAGAAGAVHAAGGRVWVLADGTLAEVDPASPSVRIVATGLATGTFAVDDTGAYVVTSGGARLEHVPVSGATTTAATGETVDLALSGPDAVHAVAVFDTTLVVAHDAGQGLDSSLVTYDAATLSRLASAATDVPGSSVVSTLAGPLVVGSNTDGGFCGPSTATPTWCVARSVLATAHATAVATLPTGIVGAGLAGPYPALVALPGSGGGAAAVYRLQ